MRRNPFRMLAATLALGLLTACSAAEDTSTTPVKPGTSTGTPSPGSPGVAVDPATNGASEIGIDQPDLSKVMFSKQFGLPGNPQRKVTVGILSLERKDRVAILKLVVTPEFADLPASELIGFQDSLAEADSFSWAPNLLDLKNLKKYKVLHSRGMDGSGMLLFDDGEAASGQPIYGWAVFAAPPPGVTSIDLNVTEWMPRFTNVPIR